uniref:Uncharacterized protein n=1 Tax=Oryza brachyantha TaxID=4533 RepID=J3NE61_ORYBR
LAGLPPPHRTQIHHGDPTTQPDQTKLLPNSSHKNPITGSPTSPPPPPIPIHQTKNSFHLSGQEKAPKRPGLSRRHLALTASDLDDKTGRIRRG